MGGSSSQYINFGLANLVSLCRGCHTWIHANPAESYEQGWLVRMGEDPARVPIRHKPVLGFLGVCDKQN